MKRIKKKLSLKKISIAKIGNANKIKGGTASILQACDQGPLATISPCNITIPGDSLGSFEPDTNVTIACQEENITIIACPNNEHGEI